MGTTLLKASRYKSWASCFRSSRATELHFAVEAMFLIFFNQILPSFDEDAFIPKEATLKGLSLPDFGEIRDFRE